MRRADGPIAYHLANVVDDHEMGITQVVRGEDLAPLTPLHVELAETLGLRVPTYLHLPLVTGPDGRKLSKTNQAAPLDTRQATDNLRAAGDVLGLDTQVTDRLTVPDSSNAGPPSGGIATRSPERHRPRLGNGVIC